LHFIGFLFLILHLNETSKSVRGHTMHDFQMPSSIICIYNWRQHEIAAQISRHLAWKVKYLKIAFKKRILKHVQLSYP